MHAFKRRLASDALLSSKRLESLTVEDRIMSVCFLDYDKHELGYEEVFRKTLYFMAKFITFVADNIFLCDLQSSANFSKCNVCDNYCVAKNI